VVQAAQQPFQPPFQGDRIQGGADPMVSPFRAEVELVAGFCSNLVENFNQRLVGRRKADQRLTGRFLGSKRMVGQQAKTQAKPEADVQVDALFHGTETKKEEVVRLDSKRSGQNNLFFPASQ